VGQKNPAPKAMVRHFLIQVTQTDATALKPAEKTLYVLFCHWRTQFSTFIHNAILNKAKTRKVKETNKIKCA